MNIEWTNLPPLPPPTTEMDQPGLGGPFAGLYGDTLIIAGGANFHDTMPWNGGRKYYQTDIYLLQLPVNDGSWSVFRHESGLPSPVAYGASASVGAGLVCSGGENESGITDEVYIISIEEGKPLIKPLPSLPVALSYAASTSVGSVVFVGGGISEEGASNAMWSIDTDNPGTGWKKLADMPLPLVSSVMVAVDNGQPSLWVMGGRTRKKEDPVSQIRSEILRYSLTNDEWTIEGALAEGGDPVQFAAGTGAVAKGSYIALFGGNDGSISMKVEMLLSKMAIEKDSSLMADLRREYISIQESHPGFSRDIIVFETETGKVFRAGKIDGPTQVTTTAVTTPYGIIIPSGEIRPGVRTPDIRMANLK